MGCIARVRACVVYPLGRRLVSGGSRLRTGRWDISMIEYPSARLSTISDGWAQRVVRRDAPSLQPWLADISHRQWSDLPGKPLASGLAATFCFSRLGKRHTRVAETRY